jgi:hypothetical protein
MLKKHGVRAFLLTLSLLGAAPLWALGVGGGFSVGSGESEWYRKNIANRTQSDYENTSSMGGGLFIDTGKPQSPFATRILIGLDRYSIEPGHDQDVTRFNFSTTFRFIVVRKDIFSFWLGPQIGIHYLFGGTGYNQYDHDLAMLLVASSKPEALYIFKNGTYNMGSADAGMVIGFDFDIKELVTISLSGGIKYGASIGSIEYKNNGLYKKCYLIYGHGFDRFADIGVLYRFDESRNEKQAEGAKT